MKMYVLGHESLKDCDVCNWFPLLICSEQTAGRQRESGSCFGELLAAGGGQPVSEHQKPLNIFCSEALSSCSRRVYVSVKKVTCI